MIPRTFMVTGLPRSRTAWCANWLTTSAAICYHDVRFDESLLVSPRRVGFSGPELIEQVDDILMDHPEAPWLVLLRDRAECQLAFMRFAADIPGAMAAMGDTDIKSVFTLRAHKLAVLCKHATVYAIDYSALDNEETARAAWNHLLPDIAFDVARWRLLCKFNVQQQKPKVWPLEQSQLSSKL